jgi:protein CpxP
MSDQNGNSARKAVQKPWLSRRGWIATGIIGAVALLAGAGTLVYAHGDAWRHGRAMSEEHIAKHVDEALADVNATDDQKAQVTAIVQAAARDVHALADQHRAAHKQLHDILSAQVIDRERLEAVRADQLRLADEASKRLVQGIADAAEVLTPEQRATLAAEMERHRRWHHDGP